MEYGTILATKGVADEMKKNPAFAQEVIAAFNQYWKNDWGDLCQEDKEVNIDGHGPSMPYNRTMTSKLHQKHKESLQDFIPVEALCFM